MEGFSGAGYGWVVYGYFGNAGAWTDRWIKVAQVSQPLHPSQGKGSFDAEFWGMRQLVQWVARWLRRGRPEWGMVDVPLVSRKRRREEEVGSDANV